MDNQTKRRAVIKVWDKAYTTNNTEHRIITDHLLTLYLLQYEIKAGNTRMADHYRKTLRETRDTVDFFFGDVAKADDAINSLHRAILAEVF